MKEFLYPQHPVRFIITGPSECEKSYFLTNLTLNNFNEYEKYYVSSLSLHQDLYQKLIKCFTIYRPIHNIPNTRNEEDIYLVFDEVVSDKDFKKSNIEVEIFETIEELKRPPKYEKGVILS